VNCVGLSHLVEFQTPTIFDREFDCHHSTISRLSKVTKILTCTPQMTEDISAILF
jgi:hypothetical protein